MAKRSPSGTADTEQPASRSSAWSPWVSWKSSGRTVTRPPRPTSSWLSVYGRRAGRVTGEGRESLPRPPGRTPKEISETCPGGVVLPLARPHTQDMTQRTYTARRNGSKVEIVTETGEVIDALGGKRAANAEAVIVWQFGTDAECIYGFRGNLPKAITEAASLTAGSGTPANWATALPVR